MSLQSDIVTALAAVAGGRVYPQAAPAETAFPFVVYRIVSKEPLATLGGILEATRYTVVFDAWATTYASALSTADAVRTAIDASALNSFHASAPGEDYEPVVDAFVEPVHYGFWVNN